MPLVEVTCAPEAVARLAEALPQVVSEAVACDAEPYDRDLRPGDVLIRFRQASVHDRFDLDVLVEVQSKWDAQRAASRQARADGIRRAVEVLLPGAVVGVSLTLPVAAWSQTGPA